jgi:hypothetical protein
VTPADITPKLRRLMSEAYAVGDQQHLERDRRQVK